MADENAVPAHIDDSVKSIAALHAKQLEDATALQRGLLRFTKWLAQPWFFVVVLLAIVAWTTVNLLATGAGIFAFDRPPFNLLQTAVSIGALLMALLIYSAQQRDDLMAQHREHLALQLAILNEQKSAKIIQLLEDLRRDDPALPNRVDSEAATLSSPADPERVLDAIREAHRTAQEQ